MSDPNRWPLPVLVVAATLYILLSTAQAQGAKQSGPEVSISDSDGDHVRERSEWFYRGRVVRGLPSAELRRRANHAKLQLRTQRATAVPHSEPSSLVFCWIVAASGPGALGVGCERQWHSGLSPGRRPIHGSSYRSVELRDRACTRYPSPSLSAIIPPPVQWCRFSYV